MPNKRLEHSPATEFERLPSEGKPSEEGKMRKGSRSSSSILGVGT